MKCESGFKKKKLYYLVYLFIIIIIKKIKKKKKKKKVSWYNTISKSINLFYHMFVLYITSNNN